MIMKAEKDGFFGEWHTPKYYLKRLAKLGCPAHIQELAKDITQGKPFTQSLGSGFSKVVTRWDGSSLYHYEIWEEECFTRVQFESDTGYVDWGMGNNNNNSCACPD